MARVPVPARQMMLLGAATNLVAVVTNGDALYGSYTYAYTNLAVVPPAGWEVEEIAPGKYLYTLAGRYAYAAAVAPTVTAGTNAAEGFLGYANGTLMGHAHTSVVARIAGLTPGTSTKATGYASGDFMRGTNSFAWAWNTNFWGRTASNWNAIAVGTWMDDWKVSALPGYQTGTVVRVAEEFFAAGDYGRVLAPTNRWTYRTIIAATNAQAVGVKPSGDWSNSVVAVANGQNAVWYQGAGLLISPIHVLTSGHMLWRHDTNRWYTFATREGTLVHRKVLGVAQIDTWPACAYVLSGDSMWSIGVFAPDGADVPHMRCLPPAETRRKWSWPTNYTLASYNQDHFFRVFSTWRQEVAAEWEEPMTRGGDSGSPSMLLLGDEFVYAGLAVLVADTNCINEAMAWLSRTNGGLPEYQIELVDVSGFPDL